MKGRIKFALWLGTFFAAIVTLVATVAALVAAGLGDEDERVLRRILGDRAPLLAFLALIVFLACAAVLRWVFGRFVTPLRALADQTRIVASANLEHRVSVEGGPETAGLGAAINRLGDAYRGQHGDMEARIAESNARLEEERNRLAALMSELSEGVLLCNDEGRILLFNEQARALFATAAAGPIAAHNPVGLGRSIFAFLDRDQVTHALDKIQYGLDRDHSSPVTMFFTSSAAGDLIRVRFAPFLTTDARIAGLVLTCEDVTKAFGQEAQRRSLLQALATRVRQPAANVRSAAENLMTFPEMSAAERGRFTEIIAIESRGLSQTIDEALREYDDALKAGVSLEDMRLADLLSVAGRRIDALAGLAARLEAIDESLWVKVDSYALAQALAAIAQRLRDEHGVRDVALRATAHGGFVELDVTWSGVPIAIDALEGWDLQPIQVGSEQTPLTLRDVIERHGGEVWHQSNVPSQPSWFRFLLPLAQPVVAKLRRRLAADSRPEYYDFDLFRVADSAKGLLGQRLLDLSFTVFDTETTGVEPSAGDRIISIGAVRIVNGRLLKQEIFEQLVDPQRSVPRDSIRIHGIQPADLAGQPTLREALPGFHRFCEDTVLVAHNAAFDMRFLELGEAETGVRFTQPVLDTLLLSAVVHRNFPDHSLEAIAERLGVPVIGRHTALGDALVTSEIFLKLVKVLAEQGIHTLAQALDASRETYYVRLQY
ncbi:MAG: exonuclease domain-containing protein [Usitatibacter sp.]